MKILITGKNSYIGNSFLTYVKENTTYEINDLDLMNPSWKEIDFSTYDVIYHVAGIAHIKTTKENELLYYKVNRDLAFEVAKKAKEEGVKHFIFMSSMSVYGLEQSKNPITLNTKENPTTPYGLSKFQGEELISTLQSNTFKVAILRPPMVYGDNAPGNMGKLLKVVNKVKVFPDYQNKRSTIDIDTLVKYILKAIDEHREGILLPQNKEYMCTSSAIKYLVEKNNTKIKTTKIFNPIIKLLIGKVSILSKVFGDLYYE